MYLSPGVAPPTYTPPPSPRSYPQRHRGVTLSLSLHLSPSFCHSSCSRSFHSSFFLFPSFFFLSCSRSFKLLLRVSPFPTSIRDINDVQHPRTSLHAAFTFPCVLTHVYFSLLFLRLPLPPLLAPGVVSPLRSPVTNAYQRT